MNWYKKVLNQYTDFKGRARRKEFWMFVLFNLIFSIIAMTLDNTFGIANDLTGYGPIYIIYGLAVLIPSIAVSVRRLHDIGKSGWMLLLSFIPLIGAIWLIVLFATDSKPGENEYGMYPKEVEA